MTLRAILFDDEYPTRKALRNLLQPSKNGQFVGEASNSLAALELIGNKDHSVISLDFVMSGLNGIDLAHQLQEKPIHLKRLEEALLNVRQLKGSLTGSKSNLLPSIKIDTITPPSLEVIPVEIRGKIILLHQDQIIYIYTDKDKVYIKTQKNSYLSRFTLRELESRLNTTLFFRSHRCYLVNIRRMRELIPYSNGTYTIVVDDYEGSEIPMSRTKSRVLKEMLVL